ncbi:hypothetical protein ACN28S_59410 [Cystobacter fuscus]
MSGLKDLRVKNGDLYAPRGALISPCIGNSIPRMRSLMTAPLSRFLLVGLAVLFALDGLHLVVTLLGGADDNALDVALHVGAVGLALGLLGVALALAWKREGVFGFSWALSLGLLLGPALYAAALWAEKHPERVPGRWMLAPFVGSVGYVLGGLAALAGPGRTSRAPSSRECAS